MGLRKVFKKVNEWEARFQEWIKTQPEDLEIKNYMEWNKAPGDFTWTEQVQANKLVELILRNRYVATVENFPLPDGWGVIEMIG